DRRDRSAPPCQYPGRQRQARRAVAACDQRAWEGRGGQFHERNHGEVLQESLAFRGSSVESASETAPSSFSRHSGISLPCSMYFPLVPQGYSRLAMSPAHVTL